MQLLADVPGKIAAFCAFTGVDDTAAFLQRDEDSASGYTLKTFVWDVK